MRAALFTFGLVLLLGLGARMVSAAEIASLVPPGATEIPLVNGGFESTAPPATAAWLAGNTGWLKIAAFDKLTITKVAHTGAQALHFVTDSSSYTVARQEVLVPEACRGKSLLLLLYARGYSRFGCELLAQWQEDGKTKQQALKTNYPQGRLGLDEDIWLPYVIETEPLPTAATSVVITFDTDMQYQDWYVDDVKLYALAAPANLEVQKTVPEDVTTLGKEYGAGRGEVEEGAVNIAPYAKISAVPAMHMTYRLTDGSMGTGITLGGTGACRLDFRFAKPQAITAVRMSLPPHTFAIFADTTGKGAYDTLLHMAQNKPAIGYWGRKAWVWYRVDLPQAVTAYGIRFVEYAATDYLMEFQIIAPAREAAALLAAGTVAPAPGVPALAAGAAQPLPAPTPAQKYLQGFTIEPWMYGSQEGYQPDKPRKPLAEWPGFKKMMDDYRFFGANFIYLFPPKTIIAVEGRTGGGPFPYDVMWPSQVYKWSSKVNYLQELCDVAHQQGIQVWTCNREWYFRDDLPYPPKEQAGAFGRYGMNVVQAITEQAASGADVVSLCQDEEWWSVAYPQGYFATAAAPTNADEKTKADVAARNDIAEARRKLFAQRWNLPVGQLPEKVEDTPLYRKYMIFYLEQVGALMKAASDSAKKANPKVRTFAAFSATDAFDNRMGPSTGISDHDLFGFGAGIDVMDNDPYFTREDPMGWYNPSLYAQELRAEGPSRQCNLTLNYSWGSGNPEKNPLCIETYPLVCYPGAVLGGALNGATAFDFWRYNFASDLDPILQGREGVKLAYSLLDTLAAWGGKTAHIPQDIAVLRSRASEDWFQLKVLHGQYDGKQSDNTRGFDNFHWVALQLFENGYPFETYMMDHPEAWADVAKFKVIVLPFPYAMSKVEFNTINAAIAKGVKVIALGAQGETDELGNPYPQPLLKPLIAAGKITYFNANLAETAQYPETGAAFNGLLNTALGNQRTLTLARYGKDIQAGCLENSDADKLVVLINWSDSNTVADLGIRMAAGKRYRILQRDLEQVHAMTLNGKDTFTPADLQRFRVPLKNGEVKILRISAG